MNTVEQSRQKNYDPPLPLSQSTLMQLKHTTQIKHLQLRNLKVIQESLIRYFILLQGGGHAQHDSLSQESGWFGSCCVTHKMCDHSVMSQDHEILPGTVAHLCYGRGRKLRERVAVYHEDIRPDCQSSGNGTDKQTKTFYRTVLTVSVPKNHC